MCMCACMQHKYIHGCQLFALFVYTYMYAMNINSNNIFQLITYKAAQLQFVMQLQLKIISSYIATIYSQLYM